MKRLGNYTAYAKLVGLTSLLSFKLIFRSDEKRLISAEMRLRRRTAGL
jgi:hypothetical protein